jgi:hypothetical protein
MCANARNAQRARNIVAGWGVGRGVNRRTPNALLVNGIRMNTTCTDPRPSRHHSGPLRLALAAGGLVLMTACASTPPPTEQMAVANAALADAVSAGSPELASAEMTTAREKMARANQAMATKDHDLALSLAQQAQVDAQLAVAKAQSVKARKSVEALQEASRALREEMARKPQ